MIATRAPWARRSKTVLILIIVRLFFDFSFVDQHHGDVVTNGVNPLALDTLQAVFIPFELYGCLAQGANQDLKQFLTDSHG